ncbi:hypothetical protein PUR34_07540 [Streptomyces sp. JV185]|uniref:hypothetical protein n=1 Tax=Streptomyces sp. JV185 TaxID=858638 RepID=UPI002E7A896A|nr:hypothetical protein [Streptomyces sp. JV185]MEE1768042.1 hypothetical protein [Streptomyces sp. JV185]
MRTKSRGIRLPSRRHPAAAAAAVAALVLVTGCGKAGDGHPPDATGTSATASASPSLNPLYGEEYLAESECAAPVPGKPGIYREAPCDSAEAMAKVAYRMDVGSAAPFSATSCAENADFVIDVPVSLAALENTQASGGGYACMRNLKPPHPGDMGGGGGPRIEIGDCVHSMPKKGNSVWEVACRTKGKKDGATHKVTKILEDVIVGGFDDPCDGEADAMFTENSLIDKDPLRNERLLCADKL